MLQNRTMEIAVGLFVAGGMAALFMLAMKISNLSGFSEPAGYELVARFENVGGLKVRSPVMASGVLVGRVADISYDLDSFEAVVRFNINGQYDRFPEDTTARIFTAGLLGEQYVALEPGGAESNMKAGDEFQLTQSALVLEQVIGQFLFGKAAESGRE